MSHAPEELEELIRLAGVVVINIGTLSTGWVPSMTRAAELCSIIGKPYVLDPVGAGATQLRTETAAEIIRWAVPAAIRGNASEILALSAEGGTTRGVDAMHAVHDAIDAAKNLARLHGTVVAATGVQDFVTNGDDALIITGGHQLMEYVTGTGCAASVVTAAFIAVDEDPLVATAAGLAYFGLAGEKAAVGAHAPGSFWVKLLDALYEITPEELAAHARIENA
jgi:hydroxyethylthiazole kinase